MKVAAWMRGPVGVASPRMVWETTLGRIHGPEVRVLAVTAWGHLACCAAILTLAAAVLGALSGCGNIWVSQVISQRYQADPILAPLGLEVTANAGEVFVAGAVQSDLQRERAVTLAGRGPGVKAAYFVELDRPDRPLTFDRFRADPARVWGAAVAAVSATGWRLREEAAEQSLATAPRRVEGTWISLGVATQARLSLQLHPRGESVTVIATVQRLDAADLEWCLDQERRVVGAIGENLAKGERAGRP